MKNWYGILGGQRPQLHQHIHESLVDLADLIRPTLTLVDSYRILLRNGPTGGNLEDVLLKKTLIAGTDPGCSRCLRRQGLLEHGRNCYALPENG
jgi:uncharacterized protein (DUF362 family)